MKKYLFSSSLAFIASAVKMQFFAGSCVQLPAGQVVVLKEDSTNDTALLKAIANNAVAVNHNFVGTGLTAEHISNRLNASASYGLANAGLAPVTVTGVRVAPEEINALFGGVYANYPETLHFHLKQDFPILTVSGESIGHGALMVGLEEAKALLAQLNNPLEFAGLTVNTGQTLKLGRVIGSALQLENILTKFIEWHTVNKANGYRFFPTVTEAHPNSVQAIAARLRIKPADILAVFDDIRAEYYKGKKKPRADYGQPSETTTLKKHWVPLLEDYFGIPVVA